MFLLQEEEISMQLEGSSYDNDLKYNLFCDNGLKFGHVCYQELMPATEECYPILIGQVG